MSDYMFMLENHLTTGQARVVAEIKAAAAEANLNLFLTGGAVRDMIGGFPIRDLDFAVEGNALNLAKVVVHRTGATQVYTDDVRRSVELLFPGGISVEIAMARHDRYTKPGGKPHVTPASIHEDLRNRDFTINALALSLNKASRGLLLDPTNGLADLGRRELRAISNYGLYDDPIRLFRLIRFQVRFDFTVADRTKSQYENARAADVEKQITPAPLGREFLQLACEVNLADVLQKLEGEGLLSLVSPALRGPKLNLPGLLRLQKARQVLPFETQIECDYRVLFFHILMEKLVPKERAALAEAIALDKQTALNVQRLDARAKKLEKELSSTGLQKPSQIYHLLSKVPAEQSLLLLTRPAPRVVHDRIKNYYGKYMPAAQEITDSQVVEAGATLGTAKFEKTREAMIAKHLNARPKRPVVEPAPETIPAAQGSRSRMSSSVANH